MLGGRACRRRTELLRARQLTAQQRDQRELSAAVEREVLEAALTGEGERLIQALLGGLDLAAPQACRAEAAQREAAQRAAARRGRRAREPRQLACVTLRVAA